MDSKNLSGADTEFYLGGVVGAAQIDSSVYTSELLAGEEFYISGADGDSNRFRFLPIRADETLTLTVGYLIDAGADVSKLIWSLNDYEEYAKDRALPAEMHFDLGAALRADIR